MRIKVVGAHKEFVGHVDGKPYHVKLDENGEAEVDDAVGNQLRQLRVAKAVNVQVADTDPEREALVERAKELGVRVTATMRVETIQAKITEAEAALNVDNNNDSDTDDDDDDQNTPD